jgi:uncharacterized membrane protein
MTTDLAPTTRSNALDIARGLAVVAMVIFHLIWDLSHFGYIAHGIPWTPQMKAFSHVIAFSFLFIAGVSLVLANRGHLRWPAFWKRFGMIAGAAALVSAGTYFVFPGAWVFFGILHCIAAASLIALPFVFLPAPAALVAGAAFFAVPYFFSAPVFDAGWLQWLGLGKLEPMTQDFRPVFPWVGATLFGVAAALVVPLPQTTAKRNVLTFAGRHSLAIYLLHQPLLFGLFTAIAFFTPAPDETKAFVAACERGCVSHGSTQESCHKACVCTAEKAIGEKVLAKARDEGERMRRLQEIGLRCADMRE